MQFVPIFRQDLDDDDKERVDKHSRKLGILGKSLKSVTIHGVQLNNWTSKRHRHTLFCQFMLVESLYNKQLISSTDSKATFKRMTLLWYYTSHKNKESNFLLHCC